MQYKKLTDMPLADTISGSDEVFSAQTDSLGIKHIKRVSIDNLMKLSNFIIDDDSGTKYKLGIKGGIIYLEKVET